MLPASLAFWTRKYLRDGNCESSIIDSNRFSVANALPALQGPRNVKRRPLRRRVFVCGVEDVPFPRDSLEHGNLCKQREGNEAAERDQQHPAQNNPEWKTIHRHYHTPPQLQTGANLPPAGRRCLTRRTQPRTCTAARAAAAQPATWIRGREASPARGDCGSLPRGSRRTAHAPPHYVVLLLPPHPRVQRQGGATRPGRTMSAARLGGGR
jgi:hypothetical protein